ncbi:hypothetical protein V1511DRAFT_495683 [Dipodascopsis uninucleata]
MSTLASSSTVHQPVSPSHKRKRSNTMTEGLSKDDDQMSKKSNNQVPDSVIDGSLRDQHHTQSSQPVHAQPVTHHRVDATGNGQTAASAMATMSMPMPHQQPSMSTLGHESLGSNGADGSPKPPVGSEEWHRLRKDNHKEVERRRRETINEGITELARIVPGCEKNKGSILQRAVQYIQQLKENEASNIEKWTLEKLLTEQAIAELSASNEKLKAEVDRAWREADAWKKTCASAGIKKKQED